ncbi:MAG: hypothetical protein WCT12_04380 [Verrucomicrobiota bacterium]|jgi:hypothetical protein
MNESEKQFSFTRAASSSTGGRAKKQSPDKMTITLEGELNVERFRAVMGSRWAQ